MQLPDSLALKRLIAALDPLEQKTLLGFVLLLAEHPTRAKDREWCAEHLLQAATVAHGIDEAPSLAALQSLGEWLRARANLLLPTALSVFVRAAADLSEQGRPITHEAKQAALLAYFATTTPEQP